MCTNKLEPYLLDYQKLVLLNEPSLDDNAQFKKYRMVYMDEFVDNLLNDEIVFGITLPHLPKRYLVEEQGLLEERESPLIELGIKTGKI